MNTLDLVAYYVNLLIIQYNSKPRARATITAQVTPVLMPQVSTQTITYQDEPESGAFALEWGDETTAAIAWDDDAETVQTKLRALDGLELVTVTGSAAGGFTVTFVGVNAVAPLLVVKTSTIDTGAPVITETDSILLLAIQNAFNPDTAVGKQLDIIGKYVGVTRTAQGATGPVTLEDDDFRVLIRMAVLTNSAQSDLATIQNLIFTFFAGQMRVYDYQNMRMSYLLSSSIGSLALVEMFIAQELLPRPMGVQVASIIYAPTIDNFFGFVSYEIPTNPLVKPFNTYEDYQEDWPWLLYENAVII
jgi:hypothetical protein